MLLNSRPATGVRRLAQAALALAPCRPVPGEDYPRSTEVKRMPLPQEPTMPNPCSSVPANSWCAASTAARRTP